jgi:hypothetical protein
MGKDIPDQPVVFEYPQATLRRKGKLAGKTAFRLQEGRGIRIFLDDEDLGQIVLCQLPDFHMPCC